MIQCTAASIFALDSCLTSVARIGEPSISYGSIQDVTIELLPAKILIFIFSLAMIKIGNGIMVGDWLGNKQMVY